MHGRRARSDRSGDDQSEHHRVRRGGAGGDLRRAGPATPSGGPERTVAHQDGGVVVGRLDVDPGDVPAVLRRPTAATWVDFPNPAGAVTIAIRPCAAR